MAKRLTVYHRALRQYKQQHPEATHKQAIKAYQQAKRSFTREIKREAKQSAQRWKEAKPLKYKSHRGQISQREIAKAWAATADQRFGNPEYKTKPLSKLGLKPETEAALRPIWKLVRGNPEGQRVVLEMIAALPKILGRRKHFKPADLAWMKSYMDAAGIPIALQMPLFRTAYRKSKGK